MSKRKDNIIQIIKIISFFIIFFQLFIFLDYLMKPRGYNTLHIAGLYGETKNSIDMVYIGGSACFVYWEPLKAWEDNGMVSYDFATDTIQAEFYSYLVKEVLKHQDPKVILLDARAFQYRDVDQPPADPPYRNVLTGAPFSWDKFMFIEDNVKKYLNQDPLSYHFDLIKFHGVARSNSIRDAIKLMTNSYKEELKGFYFIPKVEKIPKYDFATNAETPVSNETTKILDDLLDYLKTTKHKFLFVVSPYSETEKHKENFNFVESKVEKAGFDFLDSNEYYDEMGINFDTDFYNINHVNIFGSEKYTTFLEKYLKEKYNLPDRRNDSTYVNELNPLLDNWHTQINTTKKTINSLIESGE